MENVNNSLQMVCLSSLNTRVYVISHCENLQIDDDDVHFNLATDFCVYFCLHKENHRSTVLVHTEILLGTKSAKIYRLW